MSVEATGATKPPAALGGRVARASFWAIGGMASSQGLRLISNLIMTRLLFPEAFGLMAILNVWVFGLRMMSDVGIGTSVIQSGRDDVGFVNTLWTVQVLRGVLLWAIAFLVAAPLAAVYEAPQLATMLPVVGITAVFNGLESTRIFTLNRKLALGRLTIIELTSQVTGILVMILYALQSPTVWALVIGALVSAAMRTVLSHVAIPGAGNRFHWDKPALRELVGFGRWIFLSSATNFISARGDVLILAAFLPLDALGIYSLAILLARLPERILSVLQRRVLLPALSELARDRRDQVSRAYYRARENLEYLLLPIVVGLVSAGDWIVDAFWDPRWHEAGWMLQVLSLRVLVGIATGPATMGLVSLGEPRYMFFSNLVRAICLAAGIPLAMSFFGIEGVVCVIALCGLPSLGIVSYGLWSHGVLSMTRELRFVALVAAGLLLGYGLRILLTPWADAWLS